MSVTTIERLTHACRCLRLRAARQCGERRALQECADRAGSEVEPWFADAAASRAFLCHVPAAGPCVRP